MALKARPLSPNDPRLTRVPQVLRQKLLQRSLLPGINRFAVRNYLASLDPQKDYEQIGFLSTSFDFPWDTQRALELALVRTFCVPRSSAILSQTGEFNYRPQKRYDDTILILSEILENGMDSERGRIATRRMNQFHHRYPISNEEFLYVLTTFVFEPIRWNERFGWRPLTLTERLASFYYWQELGHRMNIKDMPGSYEQLERFNLEYEKANFRYSKANQALGEVTCEMFMSWFPAVLKPVIRQGIYALMDERMLEAFGFPRPGRGTRKLVELSLKSRAQFVRWLPVRRTPRLITAQKTKTYPEGYAVEQLGPSFTDQSKQN